MARESAKLHLTSLDGEKVGKERTLLDVFHNDRRPILQLDGAREYVYDEN